MVGLNSKVYHIWAEEVDGEIITKTSCKGVQKKRNELVREDFLKIIENPLYEHLVENAGFIRDGVETRTYKQTKRGLNYWYVKRKILNDGVSSTHLDI